jgi:aryl-alcohol dehydrogenase-like predicted oxidoreductase
MDIPVTRMGLGLAALGRPGYINLGHGADLAGRTDEGAMERNAHAVLDAAYDGGIRYVDAARSYGRAEAYLASWLRQRGVMPAEVTVGSKWGYTYTAAWRIDAEVQEEKDLSVGTLRRQLPETLALLGPYLRLYQIHSATLESGVLDDPAVLGALEDVRARGIAVGLTVTGARQRETIERALESGRFDSVQATWNLLERGAEPALAACHEAGVGVIVKEALANGRLTARGDVPLLAAAARRHGAGPDVLALAIAMAQPWADVVLSGATTIEELQSNLAACTLPVGQDLLAELEPLREHAKDYWRTRAALPWN